MIFTAVLAIRGPLKCIGVMIPEVLLKEGSRNPVSAGPVNGGLIDCKADSHTDILHFMSSVDAGFVDFHRYCRQTDKNISVLSFTRQVHYDEKMRVPSVLVPYPGPDPSGNTFDVYVYLRPETNGVLTESVLMKTLVADPEWHEKVKLVYLANYPGDFIQTRHLIEHHYRTRVYFARNGGSVFTKGMAMAFENRFGTDFDELVSRKRILGAFDALDVTGMGEEELFNFRVNEEDMLEVLGQNIKRRENLWIVNYDIPAILHKNDSRTDIAVMVFRVSLSWQGFRLVLGAMSRHLAEAGLMSPDTPPSRVFHHSRSPWQQLMDGIDFLWGVDVSDGGAEDDISFGSYMMNRGFSRNRLRAVISRPLLEFPAAVFPSAEDAPGIPGARPDIREGNIFEMSAGMTYAEAADLLQKLQQ